MSIKIYGISSIVKMKLNLKVMIIIMMNTGLKKLSPLQFWGTVLKVEFADIAFAIDSMLAAMAIAVTLPKVGIHFGGMDLGQFSVMFIGGMIGVILMRFAATWFVELLNKYPGLEGAAFAIVGWVGIKLVVIVLAHKDIAVLPEDFPFNFMANYILGSNDRFSFGRLVNICTQ